MKKIKIGIFGPKGRMGESIIEQIDNYISFFHCTPFAFEVLYFSIVFAFFDRIVKVMLLS